MLLTTQGRSTVLYVAIPENQQLSRGSVCVDLVQKKIGLFTPLKFEFPKSPSQWSTFTTKKGFVQNSMLLVPVISALICQSGGYPFIYILCSFCPRLRTRVSHFFHSRKNIVNFSLSAPLNTRNLFLMDGRGPIHKKKVPCGVAASPRMLPYQRILAKWKKNDLPFQIIKSCQRQKDKWSVI